MAAAAAVTPAAAASVPVDVPLGGALKSSLGLDAPQLTTAVPVPIVGTPETPVHHQGNMLPTPLLPAVPVGADLGGTTVTSPVPNLLGDPKTDQAGGIESTGGRLLARGPEAAVQAPLTMPNAENFGLPDLTTPDLGVVTPALSGDPVALLGLG
ncbi:hypothetical protein ACN20G_03965 [Streptomyces sp. BI20]|uniref:hypothetical protein n=1 Tax=Streptomyces sp. BI20 TaxID=3403460 RepID=UPI003C749687